jgi:hypothetical protein
MPFQTSENKRLTSKWLRLSIFSGARKGSQHLRKNALKKTENSITALDRAGHHGDCPALRFRRHHETSTVTLFRQSRRTGKEDGRHFEAGGFQGYTQEVEMSGND